MILPVFHICNRVNRCLPSLQYFDLSNNGLEGTIPHQLENLSHLQYLDLSSLEGGISKSFGNLCSLVILHNLSIGCAKYMHQELYLAHNQIIGKIPKCQSKKFYLTIY
jgi:hypothetical protein